MMKNKLHQFLTVFMAALVLLSSTGFGFIEHQCMMRGKTVQFISEKSNDSCKEKIVSSCCAKSKAAKENSGTYFKKTDCCKDSQKLEKVDLTPSQTSLIAKFLKAAAGDFFWSSKSFSFLAEEWILPGSVFKTKIISFSSLFHGRSMRSFVQSFLI